jgi:uncharacterized membrane protein YgcG
MRVDHRMPDRGNQSRAAVARDAALRRVTRTRRWTIAGSAALTAGFAALVSAVAPGRSLTPKSQARTEASTAQPSSRATGSSAIPNLPALATPSDLGLQGPDQAPQSVAPPPQAPAAASPPSGGNAGNRGTAGDSGNAGDAGNGGGGGGGPVVSGGS